MQYSSYGCKSVSYTHLDVYKRQEQLKAANDIGAVDGKSTVTAGTAAADGTVEFDICLLYTSRCV